MHWFEIVLRLGFVCLVLFVALYFLVDLHMGRRRAIVEKYFKGDYSLWMKVSCAVIIVAILFIILRFFVF